MACGNADVAGNYVVPLINRANGCSIPTWDVGAEATATVTITQQDDSVTLRVSGPPQFAVAALLGSTIWTGKVDGDDIDLSQTGTVSFTSGSCMYTYNSRITATLDGDSLTGRVEYRAATNGHADCGSREGCVSYQNFNGARRPQ